MRSDSEIIAEGDHRKCVQHLNKLAPGYVARIGTEHSLAGIFTAELSAGVYETAQMVLAPNLDQATFRKLRDSALTRWQEFVYAWLCVHPECYFTISKGDVTWHAFAAGIPWVHFSRTEGAEAHWYLTSDGRTKRNCGVDRIPKRATN